MTQKKSMGNPAVGETLYKKKDTSENLRLSSGARKGRHAARIELFDPQEESQKKKKKKKTRGGGERREFYSHYLGREENAVRKRHRDFTLQG